MGQNPPNKIIRYSLKLVIMTAAIMALPMILLFAFPCLCTAISFQLFVSIVFKTRRQGPNVLRFVSGVALLLPWCLMWFCLGMGLNIVVIPVALLTMGVFCNAYLGNLIIKQ